MLWTSISALHSDVVTWCVGVLSEKCAKTGHTSNITGMTRFCQGYLRRLRDFTPRLPNVLFLRRLATAFFGTNPWLFNSTCLRLFHDLLVE